MPGLICFQSVSIFPTSPLMLVVFTLKEAIPILSPRKKLRGADTLFQGFKIEIFHHSDDRINYWFITVTDLVYFFSDGIGISQKTAPLFH